MIQSNSLIASYFNAIQQQWQPKKYGQLELSQVHDTDIMHIANEMQL